jgi:hypothetical protein
MIRGRCSESSETVEVKSIRCYFNAKWIVFFFFFFLTWGCPGQITRTTTIPHGSLDILQAQEQVRHRGGDKRTHRGSNPKWGRNKSHELTTAVKLSSAGYTRELEPGHSGRAKPAKTTELQTSCVKWIAFDPPGMKFFFVD